MCNENKFKLVVRNSEREERKKDRKIEREEKKPGLPSEIVRLNKSKISGSPSLSLAASISFSFSLFLLFLFLLFHHLISLQIISHASQFVPLTASYGSHFAVLFT